MPVSNHVDLNLHGSGCIVHTPGHINVTGPQGMGHPNVGVGITWNWG